MARSWAVAGAAFCALALGASVLSAVFPELQAVVVFKLPLWRYFLLLALIPPVWFLPALLNLLIALGLQTYSTPESLTLSVYVLAGVREPLKHFTRCVAGQVAVWAVAYWHVIKGPSLLLSVWTCVSLFLGAAFLKSLAARSVARHFHSQSYFKRVQDALRREAVLTALCKKRSATVSGSKAVTSFQDWCTAVLAQWGTQKQSTTVQHTDTTVATSTINNKHQHGHSSLGPVSAPADLTSSSSDLNLNSNLHGGAMVQGESVGLRLGWGVDASSGNGSGRQVKEGTSTMRAGSVQLTAQGVLGAKASEGHTQSTQPHAQSLQGSQSHYEIAVQGAGAAGAAQQQQQPQPHLLQPQLSRGGSLQPAWSGRWADAAAAHRAAPAEAAASVHTRGTVSVWQRLRSSWQLAQRLQGASDNPPHVVMSHTQKSDTHSPPQAGESQLLLSRVQPHSSTPNPQPYGGQPPYTDTATESTYDDILTESEERLRPLTDQLTGNAALAPLSPADTQRIALRVLYNARGGAAACTAHNTHTDTDTMSLYITRADLESYLQTQGSTVTADEAFSLLDVNRTGTRVTLDDIVTAVTALQQERQKLVLTLQDTKSVVGKLESICAVVLYTVTSVVCLSLFEVSVRELWLTLSSALVAFAFIFGPSLRAVYESVVYLFLVHPFDVGDTLLMSSGDFVKVEEIALNFTTLVRVDGRRVWYPNTRLITEPCVNISRSDRLFDSVVVLVDVQVDPSVLDVMEAAVRALASQHPSEFTGAAAVFIRGVEAQNKLAVTVRWEYTHAGDEVPYTNRWRGRMLLALARGLTSAGVTYTIPPQVIHSVTLDASQVTPESRLPGVTNG